MSKENATSKPSGIRYPNLPPRAEKGKPISPNQAVIKNTQKK